MSHNPGSNTSLRLFAFALALKHQLAQKKKSYTTVKVVAHQWYWNHKYKFKKHRFKYDSNIINDSQRQALRKTSLKSYPKLLAVDYKLVISASRVVRLLVAAAAAIHAFAVPSLGIKVDAIPGKVNETWIKATRVGAYYGQCSEFCGEDHSHMPIAVGRWPSLENDFSTLKTAGGAKNMA